MVEEMGISPLEAITCSTRTSSECLGMDNEIGTLEEGKSADVLIIEGDPSRDISALHNVNTIVCKGKLIKKAGTLLI